MKFFFFLNNNFLIHIQSPYTNCKLAFLVFWKMLPSLLLSGHFLCPWIVISVWEMFPKGRKPLRKVALAKWTLKWEMLWVYSTCTPIALHGEVSTLHWGVIEVDSIGTPIECWHLTMECNWGANMGYPWHYSFLKIKLPKPLF